MNGRQKATIGTVSGISVISLIAIFSFLTNPIKEDIKEIKCDAKKLEKEHHDDVKGIGGKLDTILGLAQEQKVDQAEIKKDIQYMKLDIAEIKAK